MSTIERELEHELDEDRDEDKLLANPDERLRNKVQLDELRKCTIEPGFMHLPVSMVTKPEESSKYVIKLEHPTEGELTFHVNIPEAGWHEDSLFYQMHMWHRIDDPYELQLGRMYTKKRPDADTPHGWELVAPPNYDPTPPTTWYEDAWDYAVSGASKTVSVLRTASQLHLGERSQQKVYALAVLGVILGSLAPTVSVIPTLAYQLVAMVGLTILGLILFEPPSDDE